MEEIDSINDLITYTMENIENKYNKKDKIISTGFYDLDYAIKGLHNSSLTLIASRPAMGKTVLGFNIAEYVAIKEKIPVVIFSLGLSKYECTKRILSSQAIVPKHKLNIGDLEEKDIERIEKASKEISGAEIYIDDTPAIEIKDIVEKCRTLKLEKNIGLIVIDYLQLIGSNTCENHEDSILEIGKRLKLLSEELNLPIIIMSQLSRKPEERKNHRPKITDFVNSERILEYSDIIMLLYRDDYYYPDSEKKNIAEITIAKNRYGNSNNCTVELIFLGEYMKLVNIDRNTFNE